MKNRYDKKEDAFYIRFNKKRYFESEEIREGVIFDYDRRGHIIGIEILDASKILPRDFQKGLIYQFHQGRLHT